MNPEYISIYWFFKSFIFTRETVKNCIYSFKHMKSILCNYMAKCFILAYFPILSLYVGRGMTGSMTDSQPIITGRLDGPWIITKGQVWSSRLPNARRGQTIYGLIYYYRQKGFSHSVLRPQDQDQGVTCKIHTVLCKVRTKVPFITPYLCYIDCYLDGQWRHLGGLYWHFVNMASVIH